MSNILYIVVPCYNEQEVLPETSKRLREKVQTLRQSGKIDADSRILFVNDGSKDATWEMIQKLHEENSVFSGVNLSRNRGHQNALLAGLMTAKDRCDVTISMDADLQDDVHVIEKFMDKYYEGCDIVYGVRSSRKKDTFFKKFTAQSFYRLMMAMGVDIVYNDFYIEDGADVTIIAGCGIHGEGCSETRHDGIHAFHVGKNANVKYIENHYAQGNGSGKKTLNPVTKIYVGENSVFTLETTQISGVDCTERENYIELADNAKLFVTEKLMTDEEQSAVSNMDIELNGTNSSARIVSRSVGKGNSKQVFHPRAIGNNRCHAHVQCDSIIMDQAEISSIPEINAKHVDAQIVHEAAIGRINDEQLVKLRTFGMSEEEAEAVIIENFLN